MKKVSKFCIGIAMVSTLAATTGCFGNFALTRKVYKWNDSIAGDDLAGKFVKSLVMWGLCVIPVYQFSGFADIIIFNLIEFWTGSNPLAMNEGDQEVQIVERNGVQYQITATKNTFTVVPVTGENAGKIQTLAFNPEDLTWVSTNGGVSATLIQYQVENNEIVSATYFGANGQSEVVSANQLNAAFASIALK